MDKEGRQRKRIYDVFWVIFAISLILTFLFMNAYIFAFCLGSLTIMYVFISLLDDIDEMRRLDVEINIENAKKQD